MRVLGIANDIKGSLRKVSKDDTFSTEDVKKMLGVDERGIRSLCKKGQISLKKDVRTDRTFFLKDDVEILKKLNRLDVKTAEVEARKNLHDLANRLSQAKKNSSEKDVKSSITARSERSLKAKGDSYQEPIKMMSRVEDANSQQALVESNGSVDKELKMLMKNLVVSQENVVKKITKVLDEKLDGMDEIVIELIRCKTENEKLQQQVNRITKENYALKNQTASYKPVGFGLYIKREEDSIYL